MSGGDKLNFILQHEFTVATSPFNGKITMYINHSRNKCELLYSDFMRYKNHYITCNVINAYFNLLSEHFMDKDVAFATTFDELVYKQGHKRPVKKLHEVLKF
jgi:hypothetical protein